MMAPMMGSLMARHEEKRKEADIELQNLERLMTRMSFATLNIATGNFSSDNLIGAGKMGTVYKASLCWNCSIAIKKLYDTQPSEKQFISELKVMGNLRHINLLPFLGFCIESRERLLVYQYMPNGTLYDWLHHVKCHEANKLDWQIRDKVARGIARGLAWLHHYNNVVIVHHNITSRSILLGRHFEPKISNFGDVILTRSNARGFAQKCSSINKGELDLIIKKDVFQFGILLLEIITGKVPPANVCSEFHRTQEETLVEEKTYRRLHSCAVDKFPFNRQFLPFLKVACNCIQPIPDRRPTMVEVYNTLMAVSETNRLNQTDPLPPPSLHRIIESIDQSVADGNHS